MTKGEHTMGYDISAAIHKKDFEGYDKRIVGISTRNPDIDYLFWALDANHCNNGSNGTADIKTYNYNDIMQAIKRLELVENDFVKSDIIPFLQKISENMKNKVNILFG